MTDDFSMQKLDRITKRMIDVSDAIGNIFNSYDAESGVLRYLIDLGDYSRLDEKRLEEINANYRYFCKGARISRLAERFPHIADSLIAQGYLSVSSEGISLSPDMVLSPLEALAMNRDFIVQSAQPASSDEYHILAGYFDCCLQEGVAVIEEAFSQKRKKRYQGLCNILGSVSALAISSEVLSRVSLNDPPIMDSLPVLASSLVFSVLSGVLLPVAYTQHHDQGLYTCMEAQMKPRKSGFHILLQQSTQVKHYDQ